MSHAFLADLVVLAHLAFILFCALGGLFALRWPRVAWLHLPALAWGVGIELSGGVCPLTPLENRLRQAAGEAGYTGGFVEYYLLPTLYPEGLTRAHQIGLGVSVLAVNALAYALLVRRARGAAGRR